MRSVAGIGLHWMVTETDGEMGSHQCCKSADPDYPVLPAKRDAYFANSSPVSLKRDSPYSSEISTLFASSHVFILRSLRI
ncbi:hypothetical protein CDAR_24751 [Caerostris darwini]|uniref:Uncharacterized protein n=1 Tax=Caerostris darwini TaxID=1538125 RepID=A0AAV4PB67_9ARAC|nr:hypothetical protein CDAR_24751 [Caerostris darwini]